MRVHLKDQQENHIPMCILTNADMRLHIRIWMIQDGTDHILNICIPATEKTKNILYNL